MKPRQRWLIVTTAALLLTTVIVLPRIIGAKQSTVSPLKSPAVAPVPMRNMSQEKKSSVMVGASIHNDTSPPLRDIKQEKVGKKVEREANENPKVPRHHRDSFDPVIQSMHASTALASISPSIAATLSSFDGIPFPGVGCNCAPPDTNEGITGASARAASAGCAVFQPSSSESAAPCAT